MRVRFTSDVDFSVTFQSGIDGRMTCDGTQRFTQGQTRFFDR